MTDVLFGGFAARSGFTQGYVHSFGTLADSRVGSDGSKPLRITALSGAVSGNGATRSVEMYCGGAEVTLSRASSGSALDTGWQTVTAWQTTALDSIEFGYRSMSGSCYFARSSTSGAVATYGAFGNFTGKIGMYYRFQEVASAPGIVSVTPNGDGDQVTVVLSAPSDDGDSTVIGYRIQRATDSGFTAGLATVTSTGTTIMTGLTPGTTYYYRATARNTPSEGAGILGGAWSSTTSQAQPDPAGLGRYYNGVTFTAADGKQYNGATWEDLDGRRWNGTSWELLGT